MAGNHVVMSQTACDHYAVSPNRRSIASHLRQSCSTWNPMRSILGQTHCRPHMSRTSADRRLVSQAMTAALAAKSCVPATRATGYRTCLTYKVVAAIFATAQQECPKKLADRRVLHASAFPPIANGRPLAAASSSLQGLQCYWHCCSAT